VRHDIDVSRIRNIMGRDDKITIARKLSMVHTEDCRTKSESFYERNEELKSILIPRELRTMRFILEAFAYTYSPSQTIQFRIVKLGQQTSEGE
jgi:hypothetical protein